MNKENPFNESSTAESYTHTDPVYQKSAELAIDFAGLSSGLVIDLGAGTGVSSAEILKHGKEIDLHLVEPSAAMIRLAKERLGDKVTYHQKTAEEISQVTQRAKQIFALNCVHLFPDLLKAGAAIYQALADDGIFVFNLSAPSLHCKENSAAEIGVIKSNHNFYQKLCQNSDSENQILKSTEKMLADIIDVLANKTSESEVTMFSRENMAMLFASVNMELVDYCEAVVEINAAYQKNIWRMVAQGFISDGEKIEELIKSTQINETVPIRQGLFKLCKKS